MTSVTPWADTDALTRDWDAIVGVAPVGSALRDQFPERWVRFHYLPGSERIAGTDAQREEVLARIRALLAALTSAEDGGRPVLVLTSGWGESDPAPRPAELDDLLPAVAWTSLPAQSPGGLMTTIYASALLLGRDDDTLSEFLLAWVAADRTADAILARPRWRGCSIRMTVAWTSSRPIRTRARRCGTVLPSGCHRCPVGCEWVPAATGRLAAHRLNRGEPSTTAGVRALVRFGHFRSTTGHAGHLPSTVRGTP